MVAVTKNTHGRINGETEAEKPNKVSELSVSPYQSELRGLIELSGSALSELLGYVLLPIIAVLIL